MYNVVDTETGEVYGSYETDDEAFGWMEENCKVTEIVNYFNENEYVYLYNGNLIGVIID